MKPAELFANVREAERFSLGAVWDHVERPRQAVPKEKIKTELIGAIDRLRRTPLLTLGGSLSMIVLVAALFVLLSFVSNVSGYASRLPAQVRFFVAFNTNDESALKAWKEKFKNDSSISSIEMISSEDGIIRMQETLKLPADISQLMKESQIVMPTAFVSLAADDHKTREKLRSAIANSPEVESVAFDETTYSSAKSFADNISRIAFFSVIGICIVAISLIGTLVLLSFYAHRQELEVMKLLGASHKAILIPVVIDGISLSLIGIIGGSLIAPFCISRISTIFASAGVNQSTWWIMLVSGIGLLVIGAASSAAAGMFFLSSHRGTE